jgi:cytochrome c oxidase subunit 2
MKKIKTLLMAMTLAGMPGLALAQEQAAVASAPVAQAAAMAAPVAATVAPAADAAAPAAEAVKAEKPAAPAPLAPSELGLPHEAAIGLQEVVTDVGQNGRWMHNAVLFPLIAGICLFVLALLLWVMFRYRAAANPNPSKNSHNTLIEVIWTLVPILILVAVAVPSIRLLARQFDPPKADLTIKVIGHQWFWSYQYPDNGDFEVVSNMLKEKDQVEAGQQFRTDADGPRLLAADERMVVPAGKVVKLIVTADDVIHSFAVPAFWTKMDAIPGRLNETWFKVDRPGVYFGQCSELCGVRHGFMPIAVEVRPEAEFNQWVLSKGGKLAGAEAVAPAAAPAEPAPAAPAAATKG